MLSDDQSATASIPVCLPLTLLMYRLLILMLLLLNQLNQNLGLHNAESPSAILQYVARLYGAIYIWLKI